MRATNKITHHKSNSRLSKADKAEYLAMLSYRRPHDSLTELAFIERFLSPLKLQSDGFGNLWRDVGKNPSVLWSSHTDTVHRNDGIQALTVSEDGFMWTDDKDSSCLGADCTTGVYLMVQMIRAGVPGRYVFHRAEESGCQGSRYIATKTPEMLDGIEAAIAFDRYAYNSVITHQSGGRCCSESFATSLAHMLQAKNSKLSFSSDPNGVFTDTAEYTELVPECTNLSVGYLWQHGKEEVQNLPYLADLLKALRKLTKADLDTLVIERDPTKQDYLYDPWEDERHCASTKYTRVYSEDRRELEEAVTWYPEAAALLLAELGYTADDILFVMESGKV